MHSAPSVSYPVGRFSFPPGLLLVQGALHLSFLALWAGAQPIGWLWGLAALGGAWALIWGWRSWRAQRGWLCWDGSMWRWQLNPVQVEQSLGQEGIGQVKTVLDWQSILLLRWQPLTYEGQPGVHWLWLGRPACEQDWLAVRRAVCMQHRSGE